MRLANTVAVGIAVLCYGISLRAEGTAFSSPAEGRTTG